MQATAVMLKGKKARDCDDVLGQKIQVTVVMLLGKNVSNCGDVEGQTSKGL